MFYIEDLVNNEDLAKAWRIANNISDTDNENNLPELCQSLKAWINSEAFEIHRRLSLRTSSTLVCGAARLYRTGVCKLIDDLKKLDDSMVRRKREYTNFSSDNYDTSESATTPEQMRRQTNQSLETSITPSKRVRNNSAPISNETPSYYKNPSDNVGCLSSSSSKNDRCSTSRSAPSPEQLEDPKTTTNSTARKDQSVQTMTTTYSQETPTSSEEDGLVKNLPYGCVLVYDNYRSRVPTKIIVSSITSNVQNLL